MNKGLFFLLFGLGQKNKPLAAAAKLIAKYSYPFFYLVYALGFFLAIYIDKKLLAAYLFIPFTVYLINNGLRSSLKKPRPFQELNITPLLNHEGSPSFPSNHAACAMVIALAFINVMKASALSFSGLSYIFVPCALVTGLSRVVCGIHYPKDVALGWIIGIAGWFFEYKIFEIVFT